jgi:hypothetical protein
MEPGARCEAGLGCCGTGMVSGVHCVWRAASAFQDCKDRISSLIGGRFACRKRFEGVCWKGEREEDETIESSADFFIVP